MRRALALPRAVAAIGLVATGLALGAACDVIKAWLAMDDKESDR